MAQRILVAEDEMIVAFDLCDTVEEAGFEVEGPHAGISSAMLAFQRNKPDLAILDVQLDDGIVYPLAEKLMDENVPIIFHTGRYSADEIAERFPSATALPKPCPPATVMEAVNTALHDLSPAPAQPA
ncbi:MAG: response regulator [Erythrobacter sp.]|jgi:DNA-binding response OmpR family regulator|nr:response regulator [Erythrobacter sp.]